MSTLINGRIASLISGLSNSLIEEFDIHLILIPEPSQIEFPILLLGSNYLDIRTDLSKKILILQESLLDTPSFKKFWIECFMMGSHILTYPEFDEDQIESKIHEALEIYFESDTEQSKENLAIHYANEMIQKLEQQENQMKTKL